MPKIKKIKLQNTEYDLYDAQALHSGDSGTANITVSKATNADNATNAVNAENAQTAEVANKVGTSTVGSASKPVYMSNGVPTELGYTIETSVPSGAVFTDTITTNVVVSETQPTGQNVGDFWYKEITQQA